MPAFHCTYCGRELERTAERCTNCGAAVQRTSASPSTLAAQPPPVGSRVMGRWHDGLWYSGLLDGEQGQLRHVSFDDGAQAWLEPQDLTLYDDPTDNRNGQIQLNSKVLGQWADGNWYPGVVNDRFGRLWHVRFDDGDQAWLDAERIRLREVSSGKLRYVILFLLLILGVAILVIWANTRDDRGDEVSTTAGENSSLVVLAPLSTAPQVGMRVLAPFESGRYYFAATISAVRSDGLADIVFLDNDRRTVPLAALRQDTLTLGTIVTARAPSIGEGWWRGTVRQRNGDVCQISFDSGTTDWVNLAQIRVQVME